MEFAQLIVCENQAIAEYADTCDFWDLVEVARNLITNLILFSTLVAVIVFAYAGFLFLTSGGNASKVTRAKGILMSIVKGYLWILFAWLLIYTITSVLLKPGYSPLGPPTETQNVTP